MVKKKQEEQVNVEEQEVIKKISVIEDVDLNLRKNPSLKSKIIGCLTSNDRITVAFYSPESDWTEVVLDSGVRGFVMTKFLRVESVTKHRSEE